MTRHGEVVDRIVATPASHLPDQALRDEAMAIGRQIRRLEAARAARVREIELRGCQVDEAAGTVASWLQARSNIGKHDALVAAG